jgi:hypothetical protein
VQKARGREKAQFDVPAIAGGISHLILKIKVFSA